MPIEKETEEVKQEVVIKVPEQPKTSEEPLDTSAEFTVVQEAPDQAPTEETETKVVVDKKKKPKTRKPDQPDEVEAKVTLEKPTKDVTEESIKLPVSKDIPTEEAEDEVSIKKHIPVEDRDVESPKEEVTISLKKRKKPAQQPESEQSEAEITIKKTTKPDEQTLTSPAEEEVKFTIPKAPKISEESADAEVSLKQYIPDEPLEEESEEHKDEPKPTQTEVTESEVTIKKRAPKKKKELPTDVSVKPKPTEEDVEADVKLMPKETKEPDKGEDEVTIKKHVPVEEDEESEKIDSKPTTKADEEKHVDKEKEEQKPPKTEESETEVTIKKPIPKKKKEQSPEMALPPKHKEEDVEAEVKLPPKEAKVPDEGEDQVTIKKHVPVAEDDESEKPTTQLTTETEVEENLKLVPKKGISLDEGNDAVTIKKHVPVEDDETPTEFTIKPTPQTENVEAELPSEKLPEEGKDEVTVKKHVPVEIEEIAEETIVKPTPKAKEVEENFKITPKKDQLPEEGEDDITIKKFVPSPEDDETEDETILTIPKPKDEQETEVVIKKSKKHPKKVEEGEDEVKIKKHVPVSSEEEDTVTIKKPTEDEVDETFKTKKPIKIPNEEEEDEVSIKKYVPMEEDEAEVFRKKPAKPEETPEEVETQVTIKKPTKDEVDETFKTKKPTRVPTEEEEDELSIKKYIPVEEDETEVFIKKPTKPEEAPKEVETQVTIKRDKSPVQEEAEVKITKKTKSKKPPVEEAADELTVQKLKPVRKPSLPQEEEKEEDIPSVTFKPRVSKTKEDVEQEFRISLDSYAEEEINLSSKIKLKKPKRQPTFGEEAAEESLKIIEEVESEGPAIEEIIDEGSDAEELPLDDDEVSESFHVAFKRKPSRKYSVVHEDEEDVSLSIKKPHKQEDYEAAEIDIKIKPKRRDSVSLSEDVSLSITKEKEVEKITIIHEEEVQKGDVYYSVTFYDAEADQACDLVEGERVYVVETQGEWWFVKKHLSEDSGWVPANILMDEPQYIQFVQRKLNEKIDKLPVLEKPKSSEQPRAPKFLEKLKPITTHDGFSVVFQCKVEGYPRPQITWFRQTHIIKESIDFQMYYTEENVATLVISEVFPEDAGTFTCVAKNSAGFASSTAELTVEGPLSSHGSDRTHSISRKSLSRTSSLADILEGMPPVFAKKPKTQSVPEETDVTIDAVLAAIPEPDIKWYRNGKKVTTKENITISTTSENYIYTTTIKITKIKKKQEGRYKIVAKNSEGHATAEFTLRVRTSEKEAPEIVEPLQSTTIRKGETATLTTTIVGNPEPAIQWFKNDKPLEALSPRRNGDTYTVIIKDATTSDTGEYTVKANNSLGSAITSAFLTVQEFPDNAEPPLFVKRFEEQNIPEKTPLILRAKVTGNPIPEVTWLLNNQPLESSERVRILYDLENIELTIKETNSELDSGIYKCVATNSMGRASHGAPVNVEVDTVKFTKKLQKSYKNFERETIELECETSHSVRTKWWYNGTEISGMDHRVVIHDGRTHKLIIKNVSKNDEGNYKCTVKNQKTETIVEVDQRKLEFVKKLQDLEITEKDNAILEVEITSDTADVVWLKDGVPITDIDDKFETEKDRGVRKLLIRSTSIHDEGEYSCQLVDEECKADVTVIELPPEIITPLQDKTVTKGEKAVFEIELSKGDALAKWYKDGKEIQFSEHIQLAIDGKTQKLKIYKSDRDDQGTYTCKVGKQSSSATLTVNIPSCEWIKPLPEETVVPINTDAEFEVELSKEDAEVTWWKKDTKIESSSRYTITKSKTYRKLVVHQVTMEDQYEYTCTVEKYSLKTSSKLKVGDRPSPPRGPLEVSGMTAQSFTIQWQPPENDGNSEILEYIIESKDMKLKRDFKKIGATKGSITDFAVSELKKDHGYKFKIYARNAVGISDPYCPDETVIAGSRIRIEYHFAKTDETMYCLLGIFPPAKAIHKSE
uniref:Titin-like n=1 Tax=Dendroctonus ponderosae TaxID=77166 RepID=A0AAR5PDB0_DENPD